MRRVITYEPTTTELLLLALKRVGNASLDILLGGKVVDKKFRKVTERLRRRNLIFGERQGKRITFELTDEGRVEADKIKLKLEMAKRKRWDGKWRIIIFDVPEKMRGKRDLLRKELIAFGFMQLQKSVWAYPYKLPEEFIDLWKNAGILSYCVIIEAVKIINNATLQKFYFPKIK
ncbi:MAG: Repressor in the phenylacetic acid catabolism [Candidatus Giovannonibacteria bacterium GW2011_GWA1_43_15]|uniref:Repressor in the phenylacetic acid catabolism n=2 Tax=Candidatus Giovannoniibacteriota TaxID=1752738 RepID=A0A0G1L4Y3_9BACT|nr:MAG: Repressor in the phenylacetic acid catabolism [Candidatus Giovannonibacteria bacterium GW2011_GWB1_43_13]KKS99941.1 MAG: Repressor in the phenylacetic acid catabolism [Candidatus Giovannonibacteria bacterium GW2011_GWA1_43_15]KKT20833.1 MAG: Repressor in the phenylacetic acid catabolism [Candidatus Giovannonibacteria bacterium GW2011_GWC2_43_8]KKT63642.1 MAG: Repressor in the phenylacetic acid catabolism [Candidatus Giovannonibacteria bacterium GW2011_GWA2_44_26]OGF58892.1 MAG: hypothet